jgi:hypothetical protein
MKGLLIATLFGCAAVALAAQSQQLPGNEAKQKSTAHSTPGAQPAINVTVQSPEPDPKLAQEDRENRQRNLDVQERIAKVTTALVWITAIQALFGSFAFLVAIRAANAAKKSADVADATLRLTQRAYLAVSNISINWAEGTSGNPPFIEFMISNTGRTPAELLSSQFLEVVGGPLDCNTINTVQPQRERVVIQAGHKVQRRVNCDPRLKLKMEGIKAGAVNYWLLGKMTFSTVLDPKTRTLELCFTYDPQQATMVIDVTSLGNRSE